MSDVLYLSATDHKSLQRANSVLKILPVVEKTIPQQLDEVLADAISAHMHVVPRNTLLLHLGSHAEWCGGTRGETNVLMIPRMLMRGCHPANAASENKRRAATMTTRPRPPPGTPVYPQHCITFALCTTRAIHIPLFLGIFRSRRDYVRLHGALRFQQQRAFLAYSLLSTFDTYS